MSNSHRRAAISGVPSSSNIPAQYITTAASCTTTDSSLTPLHKSFCTTPIIAIMQLIALLASPRLTAPSDSPHPFPAHWSSSRSVLRSFRRKESTVPYAPCTQNQKSQQKRSCPVSCNPNQTNLKELDMQETIF
jgi:hypothetical protein